MRTGLALLGIGAIVVLGGCYQKTTMVFDQNAWQMVPALKPGDTLEVPGRTITWGSDKPCVDTDNPCVIKSGLTGTLYAFTCTPDTNCDPEIAIDNSGGVDRGLKMAAGVTPPDHLIHLTCDNTPVKDQEASVNQTVGWGVFGSGGNSSGWTVTIDNNAKLCQEGTTFGPLEKCTVTGAAGDYPYTAGKACQDSSIMLHGKITVTLKR